MQSDAQAGWVQIRLTPPVCFRVCGWQGSSALLSGREWWLRCGAFLVRACRVAVELGLEGSSQGMG